MKVLVFCLVVALPMAAEAQSPLGSEFRVNQDTLIRLFYPAVAADRHGGFAVAWNDASGYIWARRFDADGVPRPEVRVNQHHLLSGAPSRMSSDDRGRFVVVWQDEDVEFSAGIRARRHDATGAALGSEFIVNRYTTGSQTQPVVAMLAGGAFIVAWDSDPGDGSGYGVFARLFDASGTAATPLEFRVNTYTTGDQFGPSVVAGEGDSFVVTWVSYDQDGSEAGVFGRRYAGLTPLGGEFRVNSYTTGTQRLARLLRGPRNGFTVLWQDLQQTADLWGRRFDGSGTPQGAEFQVNPPAEALLPANAAADELGDFTTVWSTDFPYDVAGQRYEAMGTARGGAFPVNTLPLLGVGESDVAADAAGNLIAVWRGDNPAVSNIYARRFGGLRPAGLSVADGGNGVLEVADDFALITAWRNVSTMPQTPRGWVATVFVPPGLSLALSTDANYGTVPAGAVGACSGPCFAGGLVGTRPSGHVDLGVAERILPDVQGQGRLWPLHVGGSFGDVPRGTPFYRYVETLLHHGVTAGCTGGAYCPAGSATREQMAVFVLAAREGASYAPPACTTPLFNDVPASSPFCRWIEELVRRGIVNGCGAGNYCPALAVTREQMAVFVLRTLDPTFTPPACGTPVFGDVPASSPYCRWIEELARRGIVSGCGGGNYCPSAAVTREQMAVFISGTFSLTLYGP